MKEKVFEIKRQRVNLAVDDNQYKRIQRIVDMEKLVYPGTLARKVLLEYIEKKEKEYKLSKI